jgi:hypothetical protein
MSLPDGAIFLCVRKCCRGRRDDGVFDAFRCSPGARREPAGCSTCCAATASKVPRAWPHDLDAPISAQRVSPTGSKTRSWALHKQLTDDGVDAGAQTASTTWRSATASPHRSPLSFKCSRFRAYYNEVSGHRGIGRKTRPPSTQPAESE